MKNMGLAGAVRGRTKVTTAAGTTQSKLPDLVNRKFSATGPNQLWISDCAYVATWRGFTYTAFIIDVFARRIVGWRVVSSMTTELILDALELALHDREVGKELIHHSDRGSQYLSIRYTDRLAEVGIAPSVVSAGDSHDNAMAESIIGLYKTEAIRRLGPWKSVDAVEIATLDWVDWYNNRRILEPIGYRAPREAETEYHERQTRKACLAELTLQPVC